MVELLPPSSLPSLEPPQGMTFPMVTVVALEGDSSDSGDSTEAPLQLHLFSWQEALKTD